MKARDQAVTQHQSEYLACTAPVLTGLFSRATVCTSGTFTLGTLQRLNAAPHIRHMLGLVKGLQQHAASTWNC
jgi:hypothetical protein